MAEKWSAKGEKVTAVDNDEFLMLDSEDPSNATKNKRVKYSTLNSNVNDFTMNGDFLQTPENPTIPGFVTDTTNLQGARDIFVVGKYAYVAALDSDRFTVVDISEPTSPTVLSSITDTDFDQLTSVHVAGKYAYVTSIMNDSISIIDISNPKLPVKIDTFSDSINMNTPEGIYVAGKYAYVAGGVSDSLAVYDISDPTNITLTSSIIGDTVNLDGAFNVYVQGNYAYVSGTEGNSLAVIDVSDPTNINVTDSVVDNTRLDGARGVYVSGRYAYVAAPTQDTFTIVDVSNPIDILIVGDVTDSTLDGVSSVFVSGNYAYVTATGVNTITVINVSDPTDPVVVGSIQDNTNMDNPFSIFVAGKYAYVVSGTSDTLSIINITGISSPSASIGNIEAGYLSVTDNAVINNDLQSRNLNVGQDALISNDLAVSGNTSIIGTLDMKSSLINNVTDPVSAQDAATKNYVDVATTNISAFSASANYLTGDVVIEDGITLRAITDITAGAFDQTQWTVSDGLGVKNTIQVYVENDFGFPLVGGRHELATDTEYIICAPITMNVGLTIASAASNSLRAFSKEVNKIEWTGTGFFVETTDVELAFTAVSESTGTLTFTMDNSTSGLSVGQFVNINGSTYQLRNQQITGLTLNTSIDILGTDQGDDSGNVDTFANKFECQDFEVEGDGTNDGFQCTFTKVGSSEWFALHCDFEELVVPLDLDGANLSITHLCEFEEVGCSVYNETSSNIIHTANSYASPQKGTNNFEILGNTTDVINAVISNNSFESGDSVSLITVDDGGTGYSSVPTVTIDAPSSGTTATGTAVLANGIDTATINAGGTSYEENETVILTGDTSGANNARATVTVTGGVGPILTFTVTVIGSGYNSNEGLTIVGITSGGNDATATSVTTGIVDSITLTEIGSGYTSIPNVAFGGPGSNAAATAVLINAIKIDEPVGFLDATRFIITGNLDKNSNSFSLFDTSGTGLDETDNHVIVEANAKQKESKVFAQTFIQYKETGNIPGKTEISSSDVYFDIIDDNGTDKLLWANGGQEKFQLLDELNGEIQYTGLENITVSIFYSGLIKPNEANIDYALAIFQDTGSGFTLVENSQSYNSSTGSNGFALVARSISIPISPGDKLKLRFKNMENTTNMFHRFVSYTVTG